MAGNKTRRAGSTGRVNNSATSKLVESAELAQRQLFLTTTAFREIAVTLDGLRNRKAVADSQDAIEALDTIASFLARKITGEEKVFTPVSPKPTDSSKPNQPSPASRPSGSPRSSPSAPAASPGRAVPNSYASAAAQPAPKPTPAPAKTAGTKPASQQAPKDQRIMVRLPRDSPSRQASTREAVDIVRGVVGPGNAATVRTVQAIPSGIAIVPSGTRERSLLLRKAPGIKEAFGADAVEEQVGRKDYLIPFTPLESTWRLSGGESADRIDRQYSLDDMAMEVKSATGLDPVSVRTADNGMGSTCTLFVSFSAEAPNPPRTIRLFGANVPVYRSNRPARVIQCDVCWGFHSRHGCSRPARCRVCASTAHRSEAHPEVSSVGEVSVPRCASCSGPHPADATFCPLRPARKSSQRAKPSRVEAGRIRSQQRSLRTKEVRRLAREQTAREQDETQKSSSPPSNAPADQSLALTRLSPPQGAKRRRTESPPPSEQPGGQLALPFARLAPEEEL